MKHDTTKEKQWQALMKQIQAVEAKYDSLSKAPDDDVKKVMKMAGVPDYKIDDFFENTVSHEAKRDHISKLILRVMKVEKAKGLKPGDSITDGWATYVLNTKHQLIYFSSGSHALYRITPDGLKFLTDAKFNKLKGKFDKRKAVHDSFDDIITVNKQV